MINIFFDHQKFSTQKFGGISRYFATIINQIKLDKDFDYSLGVLMSDNEYIKAEKLRMNRSLFLPFLKNKYKDFTETINERYCIKLLKENNFDIFHPTYYQTYYQDYLKRPMVTTVHDMTYERLPEYFWAHDPLTYEKRLSMENASKIIAISETTKNDILRYSHISEDKIKVIYHGIDLSDPDIKKISGLPEQYILFVGDRSGYKNYYLFIRAFAQLAKRYPKIQLVLLGGGKPAIVEREYVQHLGLSSRILHFNVDDDELNYVYSKALFFVYPSLNEGFGLPILEAFKMNCPMLLSDTECFREIAAEGALFFDTLNEQDLTEKMERLLTDSDLRHQLAETGKIRLQDFPIEKSIQETLDLYRDLV